MKYNFSRRSFLAVAAAGALGAGKPAASNARPALLGGTPVRTKPFDSWPKIGPPEENGLMAVLRSGKWFRGSGKQVNGFEQAFARLTGARHCLATANGTSALFTSLNALGIEPGDEVIVPPYTFVATVNVVLLQYAMPVFVDTDIETFQLDAKKIEAAITDRTKAIVPVHLGGSVADLDAILEIGRRRTIPVLEDACQAHLAEWKGRKAGSLGMMGCFSFQASKNLNSGEGGAILTDDDSLIEKCYAFHNNSRGRQSTGYQFNYEKRGCNLRMTEFQAALLQAQMTRLNEQVARRDENGKHLSGLLAQVPGITPARMYLGCTRNAYHLYMFRYNKEAFAGLPRKTFLKALAAEGVPCSGGYDPLNHEPFVRDMVKSRAYRALYPANVVESWVERNECPQNDRLCTEAVWLTQNMLLGTKSDMEQIAEAVRKIRAHASALLTS
jgi:dTDP-4-amino-4,6-dideoxygalactose transaminase